jgi:DNA-directed RNA polymerase specialized sigma subunit
MPGFVKDKKDEAIWQKAKKAASKSKNKSEDSFSDQDWALVNHIYHKMKKSVESAKELDDPKFLEDAINVLEKARRRLSDEVVDPLEADDDESEFSEGFREFDPYEEEESAGEDWLRENDPDYRKGDDYEEYGDDEDEDLHQRSIAEDIGSMDQNEDWDIPQTTITPTSSRRESGEGSDVKQAPQAKITPEDSPQEVSGKRGRFRQPTREELIALRSYTRPWEQRAREAARLQADPSKNPVLAHQGNIIEARNKAYADRRAAYQKLISSDEYRNADPITQMEMDEKFEADWRAKNPDYLINAMQSHHAAHEKGKSAKDLHAAAKDAKIKSIISGGTHDPDAFSLEEGLQHVGGVKGEDGTEGFIQHDPASSFAMGNQDFIKQYAKEYNSKAKKPLDINEMMDYNEGSKRDISRILGPAPAKDQKFEEFFSHYYPLIGMSAHRVLKKLGLDHKHPDVDMSMLHEAGMHGLIQAINDYDHDNPSKASFATHAANKIRGLQLTAMRNQDAIPAEIRQAQKKFVSQNRVKKLLSESRHPDIQNINDRIKRIDAQKSPTTTSTSTTKTIIRRPAATASVAPTASTAHSPAPPSPQQQSMPATTPPKIKIPTGGNQNGN